MKLKIMVNNNINQKNILYIPKNVKIVFWEHKKSEFLKIFLMSNNKIYKLVVNKKIKKYCKIDKWSNSIVIYKNKFNKINQKINNFYNEFLFSWNSYFFKKLKFKGKGFRIKIFKKIKLIKFYFGRSHKTFVFLKKIKRKKINKYKFILQSINKAKLIKNSKIITNIKPINFYTLRGLRLSKQIILKRKGKKGTYI